MRQRLTSMGSLLPVAVLFFLASAALTGLQAQTCADWKTVTGWQGTYTLSSNGGFVQGSIDMYSIDETTGATVNMLTMTDGLCNQLRWQGADLHNTGSANDSTQVLNVCTQGQWFTTDTLVGSSGFPSNSELVVDATDGTFSFQPIPSVSARHTVYNCSDQHGQDIQWGTGPASNWPLTFQLPTQVGPLTASNFPFGAENHYAPYQDINWTVTFNLTPIFAGYNALTVSVQGNGSVSSTDGFISCPDICSHIYAPNSQVTLNATPGQGSNFVGWNGACSGTGPCTVTMTQPLSVTAVFLPPLQFVGVAPCRVVDTRNPDGQFGGPPLQGRMQRSFPVPQSGCNIPSSAQAYSLNVTVVPSGSLGYLTVWPTGENQPVVSTMNSLDGRVKANAAIIPAGTNGAISFYVTDTTNLVVDINGYFTAAGAGTSQFFSLPPCRVIDTRGANGDLGGPYLVGGVQRDFPIQNSPCVPANDNAVGAIMGNGDGTFQPEVYYPVGLPVWAVAVGDFNGDGKLDLVTVDGYDSVVSVLLGNGNGTFQAPVHNVVALSPLSVAVGDFNGDGKTDLVTPSYYQDVVSVLLGNGDGTFQAPVNYPAGHTPRSVAAGDFNGDGDLDLAVADDTVASVSVLLGNGDGTFRAPVTYSAFANPYSVAVGDFNGDGKPDLVTANHGGDNVSVLLNNGDGTFRAAMNFPAGANPRWVAVADFNLDGKLDLAVANETSGDVSVLLGNGNGTFQPAVNYGIGVGPLFVLLADLNGDGKPDIASPATDFFNNGYVRVLLGNGDGTFQGPRDAGVGAPPIYLAVGDFNGDHKPDLEVGGGAPNVQIQAYSFNVTVVPHPTGNFLGYLTIWPQGQNKPLVSTLNDPTGTIVANAAIVPAGSGGGISVFPSQSTDLIVDINGYFSAPAGTGLSLYPGAPCRVLDTRDDHGQPFSGERTVNVVGSPCAPSASAQAYVFNATVVPPGSLGYLTLWPDGQARPVVSTLNATDGFITSNMAIVPTSNGSIDAYATSLTQLVLDISSFFAP